MSTDSQYSENVRSRRQECVFCLMDTSDPDIRFDKSGRCNHCVRFIRRREHRLATLQKPGRLDAVVEEVRSRRGGGDYDCVIGVSGGVDSTYVAYVARQLGLRPLAVHVDNGWNSELAVHNIERAMSVLGIDLVTHVLDWDEFRDIQLSFLRASVSDGELPTDHAIRAVIQRTAVNEHIPFILTGRNLSTEGMVPWSWTYSSLDWKYVRSVHRRFGTVRLRRYPHLGVLRLLYSVAVRRIRNVDILNYVTYSRDDALRTLKDKLDWRDYGGKHYESNYTRFYQAYVLPEKFGFDKRRPYLSVLICTGELSREAAKMALEQPLYEPTVLAEHIKYVTRKLGISVDEFEAIMRATNRTYRDYPNAAWFYTPQHHDSAMRVLRLAKRMRVLPGEFADLATS